MAVANLALTAYKGEAVTYNGTHQTSASNATAVNITGWTIKVTARDDAGTLVLSKTGTVVSGSAGTYSFSVTAADSAVLPRSYPMDIWRTDSGAEKLMALGTWTVLGQVRNT